jgi:hypothetical protein
LVVQLDEIEYPSGLKRSQKFRTEIEYDSEFPQYMKNFFEFNKVSFSNRVIIRIGLFRTNINHPRGDHLKSNIDNISSTLLFKNSHLIGSNEIILTQTLIELLREHKWVENDIRLFHPEKENHETGHLYLTISAKAQTLDTKVYENNKEINDCYFDPFEENSEIIRKKLKQTIILNEEKQFKLGKKIKERDEINDSLKFLAIDKRNCLNEISNLQVENILLRKNLDRITNYDELHIEVDILSQSNQGVEMIEKKYANLLSQLSLQNQIRFEMQHEYGEINDKLSKIKIVKEKIEQIKSANNELKFNIKRNQDMLPLVKMYQEKIKTNEEMINNLKQNIEQLVKKNEIEIKEKNKFYNNLISDDQGNFIILSIDEIEEKLRKIQIERKLLEEKKNQMNLYYNLYENGDENFINSIQDENEQIKVITDSSKDKINSYIGTTFKNITGNGLDTIMNKIICEGEKELTKQMKTKIQELSIEIDNLSTRLENFEKVEKDKKERHILIDPNINLKRRELEIKLNLIEQREKTLLEEMDSSEIYCKYTINKLKQRIEEMDEIVYKELNLAKNNYYPIKSRSETENYYNFKNNILADYNN